MADVHVRAKELQLTVTIADGDLQRKLQAAQEWVDAGHQVNVIIKLRGRQKAHTDQLIAELQTRVATRLGAGYRLQLRAGGTGNIVKVR